jgi:hypothetical protein
MLIAEMIDVLPVQIVTGWFAVLGIGLRQGAIFHRLKRKSP